MTVALEALAGSTAGLVLQIFDSAGNPVPTSSSIATNVDRLVTWTAPTTGVYSARIANTMPGNVDYSLVVTRNAAFDAEANDSFGTAQDITSYQGALGHLSATSATINFTDSGWWDSTGSHDATNKNYVAGQQLAFGPLWRDYFVFDLTDVNQVITSATLRLFNPTGGYVSPDANETYTLFDVSTPIPTLTFTGAGQVGIYNDLGSGTNLGSQGVSSASNNTTVSVALNADGLAALNAARGGLAALGGAITTIAGSADQMIFAATGASTHTRQLVLSLAAPEDWYSINVTDTAHTLRLETSTPADGSGQFVNNLNPKIELYDPSGALVASGVPVTTGNRNEFIQYQPLVTGNYRVRVIGELNTFGEYFLTKNFAPIVTSASVTSAIFEGNTATVTGTFSDPDLLDTHTVVINWGPGEGFTTVSLAAGVANFTASHQYLDDNPTGSTSDTYPVSIIVRDNHNGASIPAGSGVVLNQVTSGTSNTDFDTAVTSVFAPLLASQVSFATTGFAHAHPGPVEVFVEVLDHDTDVWTKIFSQMVTTTTGQLSFNGLAMNFPPQLVDQVRLTSNPPQLQTFHAWTSVAIAVGVPATNVTVTNVPPTVDPIAGPLLGVPGQNLSFASLFGDVGTLDTHDVTWNFDDGASDGPTPASPGTVENSHVFTATGTYTVTLTVEDDDLGITTVSITVEIVAAALLPDPCDPLLMALFIGGTTDDDTINVHPGSDGLIQVTLNGVSLGSCAPTGHIIAYGQAGDDNIQVAGAVLNPAWLYGEGGDDRLNAGGGGSLLIGGEDNDQLLGGSGRDVMIGGNGADLLVGNSDDDILIAGYTDWDDHALAGHDEFWCDVLDEWNSDNDFATRVQNLSDGSGGNAHNGASLLLPKVHDDLSADAVDFLNGSSSDDWIIFLFGEDRVTGQVEAST